MANVVRHSDRHAVHPVDGAAFETREPGHRPYVVDSTSPARLGANLVVATYDSNFNTVPAGTGGVVHLWQPQRD